MLKDLTLSHFWTLTRMGMDMQRMWDFNYSVDGKTAYIDYKEFYGYEGGSRRKKKGKGKGKGKNKKKSNNGVKENNNENNKNNITVTGENAGENVNEANWNLWFLINLLGEKSCTNTLDTKSISLSDSSKEHCL